MKLSDVVFLADENIDSRVIAGAKILGMQLVSVADLGLRGENDLTILRHATSEGWAVLTHDSDFGGLIVALGEPVVGILYLRPGHISPSSTLDSLRVLIESNPDIPSPFIIAVKRNHDQVHIRIREV